MALLCFAERFSRIYSLAAPGHDTLLPDADPHKTRPGQANMEPPPAGRTRKQRHGKSPPAKLMVRAEILKTTLRLSLTALARRRRNS